MNATNGGGNGDGIKLVGVNHRTAPLPVRERFAHGAHEVPGALARVLAAGATGGVLLSTCNRTEFYLVAPDESVLDAAWTLLAERLPADAGGALASRPVREYGYVARGRDAVRHLYRVSAGLDSMVLGESQIQGQVRDAWELSRAHAGPILHRLFQTALHVGSRVRTETALGVGTASAASAAAAVAGKIFGDLAGRSALILGAGDMAELAATCLVGEGVQVTLVANRTPERARAIAERLGARALTLEEAWPHFATTDIAICSTAAPHAIVTWERVGQVVASRGGRPLCLLDLAVPRDVEPALAQLENVFLYDIDDLQAAAAQATAQRRVEIPAAERIVEEETDVFWAWYGGLGVVPVIKEFRGRMEQLRQAELERALRHLGHLSAADRARVEQFSQALLNKFMHQPTLAVKAAAEAGRGYGLLEALRRLFALERDKDVGE
ncbi:MAG: glutamyl-tRNA reductase [Gemmatimonadales bacterium]